MLFREHQLILRHSFGGGPNSIREGISLIKLQLEGGAEGHLSKKKSSAIEISRAERGEALLETIK